MKTTKRINLPILLVNKVFTLLALLLFPLFILSQTPKLNSVQLKPKLHLKNYSIEHGLSLSVVYSFAQTKDGYMWIGTEDGLNRFDGYDFKIYKKDIGNSESLPNNIIYTLFVDNKDNLWVGTDKGVAVIDDQENVRRIDFEEEKDKAQQAAFDEKKNSQQQIHGFVEDIYGRIWVVGEEGAFIFNETQHRFERFEKQIDWFFDSEFSEVNSIHTIGVRMYFGEKNCLVIFDLFQKKKEKECYESLFKSNSSSGNLNIQSITSNGSDELWVGTNKGLIRHNLLTTQKVLYQHEPSNPNSLTNNSIRSVLVDSRNQIWVGTVNGLNLYIRESESFIGYQRNLIDHHSLLANDIMSIYESKSGLVFIASYGAGFHLWSPDSVLFSHIFTRMDSHQLDSSNTIHSINTDLLGNIWLGSYGSGVFKINSERTRLEKIKVSNQNESLDDAIVGALHFDIFDNLWIGTSKGLKILDPDDLSLVDIRGGESEQWLDRSFITNILEDHKGELWIGTDSHLLKAVNQVGKIKDSNVVTFTNYTERLSELLGTKEVLINAIYEDVEGKLWVGTENGLVFLDPESDKQYLFQADEENSKSLTSNFIQVIYEDTQGNLWVGTGDGLNKMVLNRKDVSQSYFVQFTEKENLANDSIYGIVSGVNEWLWLSTNYGVIRYSPSTKESKHFTALDGLQSNEFNLWAYHKSADGEIFFGGINGVNSFYPEQLSVNEYDVPLVISKVVTGNTELPLSENLSIYLQEEKAFFSVKVSAIDFYHADQQSYRYKISGFNDEWNDVGDIRTINISGLPKGKYSLDIQSSTRDGEWRGKELNVQISVASDFWRSRLALVVYFLLFLMLIATFIFLWLKRNKETSEQYKHEIQKSNARMREVAKDLEASRDQALLDQQNIHVLNQRISTLDKKLSNYSRKDATSEFFKKQFFEEIINREDKLLKRKGEVFPVGAIIGIVVSNYKELLKSEDLANIESSFAEFSEVVKRYFSGDDLICRWDEDKVLMIESGSISEVRKRILNLERLLKNRGFNCGNGRLISFDFILTIIPIPFVRRKSSFINRAQACYLCCDLLAYVKKNSELGVYLFKCIDSSHTILLEQKIANGVESLLAEHLFDLEKIELKMPSENA